MKKLLLLLMVVMLASSCSPIYLPNGSAYQEKNIRRFSRNHHIRPQAGPRYVRPRKRGDVMHKSVSKATRRNLIKNIRASRYTVSN